MNEPIFVRILRLIAKEGPVSAKNIYERLDVKPGTVYPLVSILRELGLVEYFKDMGGVYQITDYGKQCPALRK